MRALGILVLIPVVASNAGTIPVKDFDQLKLLDFLLRIPGTLTQEQSELEFVRREYFLHPTPAPFQIHCSADYYHGARYPSDLLCRLEVNPEAPLTGEEFRFELKDPGFVEKFYEAMDPLEGKRALYSNERLWALSWEKKSRKIFRYAFRCSRELCVVTFAVKASE